MKMKKGFTLIEVIISLALIGIIGLMVSSLFSFSLKNYSIGVEQRDEQFDIRLAADIIADEVKTASHIGIFSDVDVNVNVDADGDGDIDSLDKVNSTNGVVFRVVGNRLVKEEGGAIRYQTDDILSNVIFQLHKDDNGTAGDETDDKYYLEYTITGSGGYSLSTKLKLLNIQGVCDSGVPSVDYYLTTDIAAADTDVLSVFYEY